MVEQAKNPVAFQSMTTVQLEIYAKELQMHFQEERRLRYELEARNKELERRLAELTALNQLFQQHLEQRMTAVASLQSLASQLEQLSKNAGAMVSLVGVKAEDPKGRKTG